MTLALHGDEPSPLLTSPTGLPNLVIFVMSLLELLVRERPPLPLFWYLYLGAPVLIGTGTWILLGRRNDLRNPKRLPHPPGPKGLPLLGNLFQLPQTYTWLTFADWAKQYGELWVDCHTARSTDTCVIEVTLYIQRPWDSL